MKYQWIIHSTFNIREFYLTPSNNREFHSNNEIGVNNSIQIYLITRNSIQSLEKTGNSIQYHLITWISTAFFWYCYWQALFEFLIQNATDHILRTYSLPVPGINCSVPLCGTIAAVLLTQLSGGVFGCFLHAAVLPWYQRFIAQAELEWSERQIV